MTHATTHATAAEALADKTPGARSLVCSLEEAMKMAGQPCITVYGTPGVYALPTAHAPGQPRTEPEIWHIPAKTA